MDLNQETPSENIIINPAPALQHEGEFGGNTLQAGKLSGLKRKGEMSVLDDETVKEPARKLQANLHINYRYLNDPFTEDNEHEQALTSAEVTHSAYAEPALRGTEPKTLQEAKESPEWPHWEEAIQTELTQLKNMGTWKLVERPNDRTPISNKWVFL